jgi:hypothetical protein
MLMLHLILLLIRIVELDSNTRQSH